MSWLGVGRTSVWVVAPTGQRALRNACLSRSIDRLTLRKA